MDSQVREAQPSVVAATTQQVGFESRNDLRNQLIERLHVLDAHIQTLINAIQVTTTALGNFQTAYSNLRNNNNY